MKVEFSWHSFGKYSNVKFHENSYSESRVFPCGWKDRQTYKQASMKLTVAFRNFSNAPKYGLSDCSHECNLERINVFWNCIRPPGRPETSLAATTPCRLQLCRVSRNSASSTLSTHYLSLPSIQILSRQTMHFSSLPQLILLLNALRSFQLMMLNINVEGA
jgi:hypothetical protein